MARGTVVVVVLALVGCRVETVSNRPASDSSAVTAPASSSGQLVLLGPHDSLIPSGPVGASIRRGRALLANTKDSLPGHVGNQLRCISCHLDEGRRPGSSPFVGVYSRFPQYRSRNARVNIIEDRINDCFQRSMAGKALDPGGRDMVDIIAYMAFLSRGVAPPGEVKGQGFHEVKPLVPDTASGRKIYLTECSRCHGPSGEGMTTKDSAGNPVYYPPLWGPQSFTIGAGMARLRTAAAFIRHNMPFDRPGRLNDQQSYDVAWYLTSRPRPDFPGKELDWPKGDPPPDVAYQTLGKKR